MYVKAPHYCATLVVRDGVCREAAPILRWALAKRWPYLRSYFSRKGFEVVPMPDPATDSATSTPSGVGR